MKRMEDFPSVQVVTDDSKDSPWYKADIGPRLTPEVRAFYEEYTGKSGDVLIEHLYAIHELAWPYGKYPCVGSWLFLHFPWRAHNYPEILAAAKDGGIVLDLGCCFGQDLRRMVADGVPASNMWATDLNADLWNMGLDLFNDRDRFPATFVEGDIFSDSIRSSLIEPLQGKVSVVLANQFLHLFDKERVHEIARYIVTMSKVGCMVVGFQMGATEAIERQVPWGKLWFQDVESWRQLWDDIGQQTGTEWNHDFVRTCVQTELGWESEDHEWMSESTKALEFVTRRVR